MTRTRIEALVVLIGVAGYLWTGLRLPPHYHMPGVPGPTVFPLILGAIMAGGALWLLLFSGTEEGLKKSPSGTGLWHRLLGAWRFFLMWGLLTAYVFLMPGLGFVISSAVLLAALFFLLGEKRWYLGIPIALVFTIGIYMAFAKGLHIRLPLGILKGMFRW